MNVGTGSDEDRPVSVRLDLHLGRQPISGRLRTEWGTDERFVGWLGLVDALTRLNEHREGSADAAGPKHATDAPTTERS
jgi:hypothetical protein